jgi:hypothetical protein
MTKSHARRLSSLPNMMDLLGIDKPENYQDLILDEDKTNTLRLLAEKHGLYLSLDNSKVTRGALAQGYSKPVSFGKIMLVTCFNAGRCMDECYQISVESMYAKSYNAHLYNSLVVANFPLTDLVRYLEMSIQSTGCDIVRLYDDGDISSPKELKMWDIVSARHPEILFYGYTKASPQIYQTKFVKNANLHLNLSDNGSEISLHFAKLLQATGLWTICHVEYTDQPDMSIPFNNEEEMAIRSDVPVFQIGYHGSKFPAVDKFFKRLTVSTGIKSC